MLTVEESAFLEEMRVKHLPGQHNQESHGNDVSADAIKSPLDKLKLDRRIQLGPGEKLLSSRKFRTRTDSDTFDLVAAEIDTPQGRQIRLGVVAFAKNWAAGPDPETARRKAELNQQIEALEDGPELFGADLDHLDALREEVEELGSHYETRYDRTVILAPDAVAKMRADIEAGVAEARQLKKDFEKFWDDHADDVEFGDTEITHAEGILTGGLEGDLAYEVRSDDEAEWNVHIGVKPPDAKPNWYIGSVADDEAVIGPSQLKAFIKDLDELSGNQPKAFLEAMAAKHLPGRHNQRDHGRRRPSVPDAPSAVAVAEPKPPTPRRQPKLPASNETPKPTSPRQPRTSRATKLTPARAQAMQDGMLSGNPWTAEHTRSLRAWTTSGFHDIRMMIGNPDHDPFLSIGGKATVKAHIRNIHGAMRPLPKPVKVFRKTDAQGVGLGRGDDPRTLVGKRKQNANFTATSIEADAGFLGAPRPIHIEIDVPAGTSAAYLESITETKGEREMLLDAGAVLEFTDASVRGDGVTLLKARVIA